MINTEITQVTYLTRADQTVRYSIPFVYNKNELTDAPELTVTLNGTELVFGTDYTVNESGLQLVSAVEEGLELIITRTSVFEQLRDFQTGIIDPEQIEGGFDDSVMRDQELKRDVQKVAESLETETVERMTADTILQGAIDDEANARILADGALQTNIDNEALARSGADTTLQTNIDNEALARANADSALQTAVDAKQNALTAGNGIQIENDVIGVTDSVLMNQATADSALNILGTEPTAMGGVSIGVDSRVTEMSGLAVGLGAHSDGRFGVAVGTSSKTTAMNGVAVGSGATSSGSAVAIGVAANAKDYSIAIGNRAKANAYYAVQISTGVSVTHTNNDANTFKFGNRNGNFEIISADGTIPSDRLASGGTVGQILTKSASGMTWNSAPAIDGVQLTSSTTKADLGLSNLYTFKGSVSTYSNLPSVGNVVGDVYNVEDTGKNYAWTANGWDSLGGEFTAPVSSVNGMTGAVVLGATDVGALPTTGGTITGQITLGSGANIVGNNRLINIGSSQYPIRRVYADTLSSGDQYGRFMIPGADPSTFGFFIAIVDTMPTARQDLEAMIFQYMGATDSNYTHGYFYECVTDDNTTWYWKQLDVQPAGSSYTAGSGIDITNDVISTSSDVLKNLASISTSLNIGTTTSTDRGGATSVGINAVAGNWGTAVGHTTNAAPYALALGQGARAEANGAIQLSCGGGMHYNAVANTFKVANSNGNYELMSADGTIPEARLADTTSAAQGQVLTLDSNLNAVWQASSDAVSSVNGQTGAVVLGASDVGALPTSGGTITGQVVLAPTASIVPTNLNQSLGSNNKPFATVYAGSFSEGEGTGRWFVPIADSNTLGVIVGAVYSMPSPSADLESVPLLNLGVTDSNYTHGYIYECVTDDNTTWYWKQLDVQPSSGGATYTAGNGISIDANNEISVADPVLVNRATGSNSVAVGASSGANVANATCIGVWSGSVGAGGVAIGSNAYADTPGSVIINSNPSGNRAGNQDSNTFRWQNANGNYMLFAADGTIPTARLTKVNTTAVLAAADWSSNTQTVTVNGITSTSVVFVAPDPSDAADYAAAGILCTSQTTNSLTFTATTTPTNDIDVNIVCL